METSFKAMKWILLAKWGEVSTVAHRICNRFTVFEQHHPFYMKTVMIETDHITGWLQHLLISNYFVFR
jgi:hypothetical protein